MARVATLRFLRVLSGSYIDIDEDFISGINAVPSSLRITAALPANVDLRIEMIAYYTLGE